MWAPTSAGPVVNMTTLADLLVDFAQRGSKPAILVDRDESFENWSFLDLADQAHRLAKGLAAAGVQSEEPIAIWAPNGREWVVAYFAIIAAGATAVPLDPLATDSEIAEMMATGNCRRIFTSRARLNRLPARVRNAEVAVYILDADLDLPIGVTGWKTLLTDRPDLLPRVRPEQRASLLFTSGTTGT